MYFINRSFSLQNTRSIHYLRSQLFIPNTNIQEKKTKTEEKLQSTLLLERNGFISDSGAGGLITYLPLGKRVLVKLISIIREEMNRVGGQEIDMPCLADLKLWDKTNRNELMGSELFRLKDRKERQLCLCPTHEEIVTSLVSKFSKSLNASCLGDNQVLSLYQITRKFRDESHPKHGLLRAREFLMKDMYSFHLSEDTVRPYYDKICDAYENVFKKLNLNYIKAQASVGAMGGSMSHEFHIESKSGEDKVFQCPTCNKGLSKDLVEADSTIISQSTLCEKLSCSHQDNKNSKIEAKTCIEIGHTFVLGNRYTKVFPIETSQTKGKNDITMGCYGIGVSRLIQACVDSRHQENLYPNWPAKIAPFKVTIIPPKKGSKEELKSSQILKKLLNGLSKEILLNDDVLVDDRVSISIGSRIIDAKLIGSSFSIILGKVIYDNKVEIILNTTGESIICNLDEVCSIIKNYLNN